MAVSKGDHITALALELLEDAELSRISVDSMVLKASRLARLVGDQEAQEWLWYERHNYDDHDPTALKYLALTERWIDVAGKKAFFAGIAVQEATLDAFKQQLDAVKAFVPSGPYAQMQLNEQRSKIAEITPNITNAARVISAVRAQIQDFATRIYHERLFSHQSESIFQAYQEQLDALLAGTARTAFERLPHAFERLGTGDAESISHALTTCRRVIDSFANAVFPPKSDLVHIGHESIEVGERQVRNRLRAYMHERIGQCSRYDRLNKSLGSLYDRVSAGVHADVDAGEARALVLQTYLFLGELLSLPDRDPSRTRRP
jgi:hypothetical protein